MSYEFSVVCNLGQRSPGSCGPGYADLQTLGELDATAPCGNQVKKLSWMVLSRVGVNYLVPPATYSSWTVCQNHRREFLDNWQVEGVCCYPDHQVDFTQSAKPTVLVSLVMSVKLLQATGKVVPISGKICVICRDIFESKFGKKEGEKIVLVMRRGNIPSVASTSLAVPSPFVKQEPGTISPPSPPQRQTRSAAIILSTSSPPSITIKSEDADEDEVTFKEASASAPSSPPRRRRHNLTEADLSDDGSDDDRTWRPPGRPAGAGSGAGGSKRTEEDPSASEEDEPNVEEEEESSSNAIEDGSSADLHYFCRICQITFYKHTSYKQHMRNSKKIHKELQKKDKEEEEEFECSDCCIAFKDKSAQLKHLATIHKSSPQGSFYCEICEVSLRSESAYRSHNSKLHLERNNKTYYCRECDDIFTCKVKHQTHIKTHRLWSGEDPGLQCTNCGKVFLSSQQIAYQRHLATHEFDEEDSRSSCACPECQLPDDPEDPDDDDLLAPPPAKRLKKTVPPAKSDLFTKMQSKFVGEDEVENIVDPLATTTTAQFECGVCQEKFTSVDDLSKHVEGLHKLSMALGDAVEDEHPEDVEEEEEEVEMDEGGSKKEGNGASAVKIARIPPVKAVGPDGMDRNWAATFGYGKTTALKATQSFDLISQMKVKFDKSGSSGDDDAEDDIQVIKESIAGGGKGNNSKGEIEDDEFKIYRVRGFKGRIKASLNKTPRTLSASSRSARKRMEMLVKSAREQWAKKEKKKKGIMSPQKGKQAKKITPDKPSEKQQPKVKKKVTFSVETKGGSIIEEDHDDEEDAASEASSLDSDLDFDGDFDDDEGLLIPLANSWVCEKRPDEERTKWLTFFWSPEGDQYSSIREVETSQGKLSNKLDMALFKRAWNKDPGRLLEKLPKDKAATASPDEMISGVEGIIEAEKGDMFLDEIEERLQEVSAEEERTRRPRTAAAAAKSQR